MMQMEVMAKYFLAKSLLRWMRYDTLPGKLYGSDDFGKRNKKTWTNKAKKFIKHYIKPVENFDQKKLKKEIIEIFNMKKKFAP
ncbi:hypothetical protein NUSPORA_02154 [Nucleospora cyclopteri]